MLLLKFINSIWCNNSQCVILLLLLLHYTSRARRASTGSVRLAISRLKQVMPGYWKSSGNSGRQGHTWTMPASPATSVDVLVRRGSGYMHIVALTYQPEFIVIRDPSCWRLSPPLSLQQYTVNPLLFV